MKNFQTIKKTSLLFLLIVFIIQSCTIEKRAFMPGYHIDWRSHKSIPASKAITEKAIESNSINDIDTTLNIEQKNENKRIIEEEKLTNTPNLFNEKQKNNPKNITKKTNQLAQSKSSNLEVLKVNEKQKSVALQKTVSKSNNYEDDDYGSGINTFALISFIASVLAIAFISIMLISLALAITGLVLGIIGNNEISRGDYQYGLNKTFAILGIVISSIAFLINIIAVLLVIFLILLIF